MADDSADIGDIVSDLQRLLSGETLVDYRAAMLQSWWIAMRLEARYYRESGRLEEVTWDLQYEGHDSFEAREDALEQGRERRRTDEALRDGRRKMAYSVGRGEAVKERTGDAVSRDAVDGSPLAMSDGMKHHIQETLSKRMARARHGREKLVRKDGGDSDGVEVK